MKIVSDWGCAWNIKKPEERNDKLKIFTLSFCKEEITTLKIEQLTQWKLQRIK